MGTFKIEGVTHWSIPVNNLTRLRGLVSRKKVSVGARPWNSMDWAIEKERIVL